MSIRSYNAYTPGTRNRSVSDFNELTTLWSLEAKQSESALVGGITSTPRKSTPIKPEKKLTSSISRSTGRNNRGIITSGHKGGGHKQNYRSIDFKRNKYEMSAIVQTIEYDPNRNARIALVCYQDGEKRYILHPLGLNVGNSIVASEQASSTVGNSLPLMNAPLGVEIHNIELHKGRGGQLARSAGAVAQIIAKEGNFVTFVLSPISVGVQLAKLEMLKVHKLLKEKQVAIVGLVVDHTCVELQKTQLITHTVVVKENVLLVDQHR